MVPPNQNSLTARFCPGTTPKGYIQFFSVLSPSKDQVLPDLLFLPSQVRQELASPSEFYPATLGQGSQSNFLTATGPAQQVRVSLLSWRFLDSSREGCECSICHSHTLSLFLLWPQVLLPVVESPQLPPVVNFGSLQQAPPAASAPPPPQPPPPPMPLVPVAAQALRPPGQLAGRLVSPAIRAFPPGGVGRNEVKKGWEKRSLLGGREGSFQHPASNKACFLQLHALEMKPMPDYRKLNGLGSVGARPPSGNRQVLSVVG